MKSIFFKAFAGLAGGLLAWVLLEPSAPTAIDSPAFTSWSLKFTALLAGLIAVAVCSVSGLQQGSWMHVLRQTGLGLIFGLIGGLFGMNFGSELVHVLMPSINPELGDTILPVAMAWRVLALAPFAIFIGIGIGAAGLSLSRTIQGGIGGLLGGIIAGLLFDPLSSVLGPIILASQGRTSGEVGGPARGLYAALVGFGIGLFIGIAERVMRSAWVRLHLGRNEGKEWAVDRPQMSIGRSELADIPLRGDPGVAPIHAYIAKHGDGYILADAGTPMGTYLNGQRIMQAPLAHGNWIQIGGMSLEFLMKAGAVPNRGMAVQQMGYPIGQANPSASPQGQVVQPIHSQAGGPGQATAMYMNPPMAGYQNASGTINMPQSGNPPAGYGGQQTMMDPAAQASFGQGGHPQFNQSAFTLAIMALDGSEAGKKFPIQQAIDVGRDASNSIGLIHDPKASRKHARLAPQGTNILVTDLGSTNGTYINDARISTQEAKLGDIIRIGGTSFRIVTY